MTKNNLGEHLAWLLQRGPTVYSLPDSTRHTIQSTQDNGSVQNINTRNLSRPAPIPCRNEERVAAPEETDRGLDFELSDEDMARLHQAPTTVSKTGLSSSAKSSPLDKKISSSTGPATPDSSSGKSRPRTTPARQKVQPKSPKANSSAKSAFSYADIESIDLTGDADPAASSGNVSVFGNSQQLWLRDGHSIVEYQHPRGTKRKSVELDPLPDRRLSASKPLSPAHRSHPNHTPPLVSKQNGSKVPIIADSDDDDVFEDVTWYEEQPNSPPLMYPQVQVQVQRSPPKQSSNSPHKSPPRTIRRSPLRCSGFSDRSPSPLQAPVNGPVREQVRVRDEGSSHPVISAPERPHSVPRPQISITPLIRKNGVSSLTPTNSNVPQDVVPSAQKDALMTTFDQMSLQSFDNFIHELRKQASGNSLKIFAGTTNLNSDFDPSELLDENKTITARIAALESLKIQKQIRDTLKDRHDQLKNKIVQLAVQDPALLQESNHLNEVRSVSKRLQDQEGYISRLDSDASIFNLFESKQSSRTKSPDMQVLVSGTQFQNYQPQRTSSTSNRGLNTPQSLASRSGGASFGLPSPDTHISPDTGAQDCYQAPEDSQEQDLIMHDSRINFSRKMDTPELLDPSFFDDDDDADDAAMIEAYEEMERTNNSTTKASVSKHYSMEAQEIMRGHHSKTVTSLVHGSLNNVGGYPWSEEVKLAMVNVFGLSSFRHNQLEAINTTLNGEHAFVLMPTGGGKSLCYQLPAIVKSGKTRGVTVVVSPLLSLMDDQTSNLQRLGVRAIMIHGGLDNRERLAILNDIKIRDEEVAQLVYVTPEMVSLSRFFQDVLSHLHNKKRIARFVIDEAHCVSQWGHDFRPDYKDLGNVISQFRGVPVMALTATATPNVEHDVKENLKVHPCHTFTQSFNRPNLEYEVRPKGNKPQLINDIVGTINHRFRGKSGIIYCISRKRCEEMSRTLRQGHRIRAFHYHAGMTTEERTDIQRRWQAGAIQVIVATIAFGMGIDKPDVRFVIHESIPKSLEGYYQETGRAGRDAKHSMCILYYKYQDTIVIRHMINESDGDEFQKQRQSDMLRNVVDFCQNNVDCRRVQLLSYFAEKNFDAKDCNKGCDNCKSSVHWKYQDFTPHAQKAVALVQALENKRLTLGNYQDLFRGVSPKTTDLEKLRTYEYEGLSAFGAGKDLDRDTIARLFQRLYTLDIFTEDNSVKNKAGYPVKCIKLGKKYRPILSGSSRVQITVTTSPGRKTKRQRAPVDDPPQSTNVSSPVQGTGRRRAVAAKPNSHRPIAFEPLESDDDFEPVRGLGRQVASRRRELGPPIAEDVALKDFDSVHTMVVDDFVIHAKNKCQEIMFQKNLRDQPFPDSILRQMAMYFPANENELLGLRDIDPDKVYRYSRVFLPLIQQARNRYSELKDSAGSFDAVPESNNRTVIAIDSDEEADELFNDAALDMEIDSSDEPGGTRSAYFDAQEDLSKFRYDSGPNQELSSSGMNSSSRRKRGYGGPKSTNKKNTSAKRSYAAKSASTSRKRQSQPKSVKSSSSQRAKPETSSKSASGRSIGLMPT